MDAMCQMYALLHTVYRATHPDQHSQRLCTGTNKQPDIRDTLFSADVRNDVFGRLKNYKDANNDKQSNNQ